MRNLAVCLYIYPHVLARCVFLGIDRHSRLQSAAERRATSEVTLSSLIPARRHTYVVPCVILFPHISELLCFFERNIDEKTDALASFSSIFVPGTAQTWLQRGMNSGAHKEGQRNHTSPCKSVSDKPNNSVLRGKVASGEAGGEDILGDFRDFSTGEQDITP
jgi:hypothetical protein